MVVASNIVLSGQPKQVVATFQKEGKELRGADPDTKLPMAEYKIYSDEMLYIQDPHDLYKHWPPDVWQAVEAASSQAGHERDAGGLRDPGMGVPDAGDTSYQKTVHYPNGGKPLVIVYHGGKAAEINPGTPPS